MLSRTLSLLLLVVCWLPHTSSGAYNNTRAANPGIPPLPLLEHINDISNFARSSIDDVAEDVAKLLCIKV